ncbi:MAG: 1,6-anhydro-N-acetylmuramyl-L-alanine amidase AmpD [Gammaproteobacteria bacterium]|nr:1,6-anhydro-N-acetylmuramyl-L-alanine amidase AmpD [Gammaproteobacteria bacterium]MDH4254386.1 1,6-anhydro-N-acetylmuramyl-L-alanine amidase AmpD [Gammaproteobacteria bacterium]MDH5309319.1 1,6-anhydro-N-acetylmuramyl-L-alanine amidase AmpD [Gammaproteobacteria bacterium]
MEEPFFEVTPGDGMIRPARQVRSPNQDDRPGGCEPELVVVHGISLPPGEFGGPWIEQLFTNRLDWAAHGYFEGIRSLEVSAHLLIRRDGELIQFVPFTRRAWHAGHSVFRGRSRCNDYSIGIELEGSDDTPYAAEQYRVLVSVLHALRSAYPGLDARHVAAHSDIAPGRKSDPGPAFDWFRLYDGLSQRHRESDPNETA